LPGISASNSCFYSHPTCQSGSTVMDREKLLVRLNQCLQERNRIFPQRDEKNDREVKKELACFIHEINRLQNEAFVPDTALAGKAQSVLAAPVFLCGSMKSGTTLLLGLLDGHPELLALPGDSYFIGRMNKENPPATALLQTVWDDWVRRMVNPTGQEPFWIFGMDISPYVVFRQYLQYWYDHLPHSWHSSVISVLLSYFCANPTRPSAVRMWVEKTPGNEFNTEEIIRKFPNARFIHIVRDPRENLASLKRLYATRSWPWDPLETARTLAKSCCLAEQNQRQLGQQRYQILHYEKLTEDPHTRMMEVADFLEIQWDESLLHPTVNGVSANANSMYEEHQVTGTVRKATEDKWRTVLTGAEQRIALGTLQGAKNVGYDWKVTGTDFLLLWLEEVRTRIQRALIRIR
jgi:hypothetical protein